MNAFVDPELCIGCTQCAGLCPAVFRMEGVLAVAEPGGMAWRYDSTAGRPRKWRKKKLFVKIP